jgi:NAD(P)-dependent dehydrogenase (short-subunit alcohol dehydrogenase family)
MGMREHSSRELIAGYSHSRLGETVALSYHGGMRWEEERVLITGAARRLGRSAAEAFAERGAEVIIHYHRSADAAEETVQSCRARGVRATAIGADLASPGEAGELFARLEKEELLPTILVNSASVYSENGFENVRREELEGDAALTAYAPLELCRCFSRKANSGSIINVLDARMVDYDRSHLSYHLAKETLFHLTRILAVELAPGFRVNGIAPGIILPPEGSSSESVEKFRRANPLQLVGSPEDFTEAMLFLAGSRFNTGDVLFVDGGRHLKGRMYGV